jgi:hypothetical protein
MAVSFIGGGNRSLRRKPQKGITCTVFVLRADVVKTYHMIFHYSHENSSP